MSISPGSVCFLDSCVVLSDIFGEKSPRVEKFKQDVKAGDIECYISQSVYNEFDRIINIAVNTIGNVFRNLFRDYVIRDRKRLRIRGPLCSKDIRLIERFFAVFMKNLRKRHDIYRNIEEFVVFAAEKNLTAINIDRYLVMIISRILEAAANIERAKILAIDRGRLAKLYGSKPDRKISARLISRDIQKEDARHIASAAKYGINNKAKVLFVTLDYKTVLNSRELIYKVSGINCMDPLYAKYYF